MTVSVAPAGTAMLSTADAVEVFVRGFCFMKSSARPYFAERLGELWLLHDPPGARRPRKAEVVAHGMAPAEVVRRVRAADVGWHFVCHLHESDAAFQPIRDAYKRLGYRALATEWMFAIDPAAAPAFASQPPVRRVRAGEDAARIQRARRGQRAIRAEHLVAEPAPQRLYAVMDDGAVYGWVSSVPVERRAWVADLFVEARHRGRGFGRALMSALLADDRAHGVTASLLLASSDGARLYPHLGYRRLGVLQIFSPLRRATAATSG
jgi:GNAT superfamily N-acetyltransferase